MALSDLPRLQSADMTLLGSFTIAGNAFAFGGHGMCYDAAGNGGAGSLWVSGSDSVAPSLGEISIPALGGVASVLTPATFVPNMPSNLNRSTGSLVYNDRLIYAANNWYSPSNPVVSHWRSSDKTVTNLGSPVAVGGEHNPAYYSGYMGFIPAEWQAALGGPCFTGQGAISIAARMSWGPAIFAFDPDDINTVTPPVPAQPLMYFTESNPLSNAYASVPPPNTAWNFTQAITGIVFPAGTRSVCVICSMGVGPQFYGEAQGTDPEAPNYDPLQQNQGYHAWPYQHRVLAFDATDLQAVKDGTLSPWAVQPYATWQLEGMGTEGLSVFTRGGLAYNPATRRIYAANGGGNGNFGGTPRVWVLEHAELTTPEPPIPPIYTSSRVSSVLTTIV